MHTFTTNARRTRTFALAATALLGASLLGLAPAAQAGEARQATVEFGDLNLRHESGASVLYARIAQAALQVCPDGGRDLASLNSTRLCREQAIARAVGAVGNPAFTAWYVAKKGYGADARLVASR